MGVDLGKKVDFSTIGVTRRDEDALRVVGLKIFPLGTEYSAVIGFLKVLNGKLGQVHHILMDQTGVGESVVEEARKAIPLVTGIVLSLPVKQDVENYLKFMMNERKEKRFGLAIPYQLDLATELNVERFELTKTGQLIFSHPSGTHDDRHWGVALSVYGWHETDRRVAFKPVTRAF